MPVRHKEHQPYHFPGRQLSLRDRLSPHEFVRRQAIAEFIQRNEDPRSFETVMRYVGRIVEHFSERFDEEDLPIFEKWHTLRVTMLDLPLDTPDYAKMSHANIEIFDKLFFTDPKTGRFDDNKYFRVQPVIKEITYLVSKGA
jgi:hypothetical protein